MRRRGFSLIELLVVIAIIAILAAILFPIFLSAKNAARWGSCASNLKQMGIAYRAYIDDYDGVAAPFKGVSKNSYDAFRPELLATYAKAKVQRYDSRYDKLTDGDKLGEKATKPWICPGDQDGVQKPNGPAIYRMAGTSYAAYNYEAVHTDGYGSTKRVPARPDQWAKPSRDFLMADCMFSFHGVAANDKIGWGAGDKEKCLNVLLLDGHVRRGTRDDRNANREFKDLLKNPGAWAYADLFDNPYSQYYNPGIK